MNIYALIILTTILVRFFVNAVADRLNIRSLFSPVPGELSTLYDPEKYRTSQEYSRTKIIFGVIEGSFDLALLLIFWLAGGFEFLDRTVRSWGFNEIITGLLYIGILGLANLILSLPFDIYSTFVIEEKFGFNKTTPKIFVTDRIKGLALSLLIGAPALAAILWFFQATGSSAWIYCWVFATVFSLLVQFIAPTWIMPLFNKFTPLPEGELKSAILSYAGSVKFSIKDVFVIDGSRRSTKANAFFTGFGKNKRIALFDTLLDQTTTPEVVSVVAHEIGHYKLKHIIKMMLIGVLQMGALFYLLSIFVRNRELAAAFYMKNVSVYAGLIFFALLYEPVSFLLGILMNMFSRKNEFEADQYAVKTTDNRENMINALKKLSLKSLSNLTPHPFYVFLHYSHPALMSRIRAIRGL